jgi:hypothetical protein
MPRDNDTTPGDDTTFEGSLQDRIRSDGDFRNRIKDTIDPYLDRIAEGVNRAVTLVEVSRGYSDPTAAEDILRAAVVLNHAYLEDLLRTLASSLLPDSTESVLNDIPLAGLRSGGRPEKFFLGKLAQHKGKTIDAVIRASVSEYLERSNYNDIEEIAQLLTRLGFNVSDHSEHFPVIQEMIQRRHVIVHRADRAKAADSDAYVLQAINSGEVLKWPRAILSFIQSLMEPLFLKLHPAEDLARKFKIPLRK